MSIANFPLADAGISDAHKQTGKKLMPRRVYTAVPDRTVVPEPR